MRDILRMVAGIYLVAVGAGVCAAALFGPLVLVTDAGWSNAWYWLYCASGVVR